MPAGSSGAAVPAWPAAGTSCPATGLSRGESAESEQAVARRRISRNTAVLITGASAVLATVLMRATLDRGYRATRRRAPPKDPADPGVDWQEALAWTVASSLVIGLGRLLARRSASAGLRRAGYLPAPRDE